MQNEMILLLRQLVQLQRLLLECVQVKGLASANQEWLDGTDTKQLLHISDSTLYRLVKQKKLEYRQVGGKRYYLKGTMFSQKDPPSCGP